MKLKEIFFARDSELVARELVRKYLVREIGGKIVYGEITATDAYKEMGKRDNKSILHPPGKIYIYNLYGKPTLNISTEWEGIPACVLIREIEKDGKRLGPIKLTGELEIGYEFDGLSIEGEELHIDDLIFEEIPSNIPTCVKRYRLK
ncbi:MAG: hypothetical protein GTN38_02125 [Candidatus Aenigmarchaeota archaeon]|nr:hypothetical protein [Candidatus Aenigmarchaeota archaeon]NIP40352.1 hypothetical protein [Candidatus Aenigmarchaeota archaeon]NIQ18278.1 hypothetical protein [Candidatus Aenigmarchaeota archaeon]NIS73230.1 hypothetical protein [Candidatus Aenigmarchaeota archaeon]